MPLKLIKYHFLGGMLDAIGYTIKIENESFKRISCGVESNQTKWAIYS